jgi:predicted DNA-binding antitoxin AbrB/MazE fold protein
VSKWKKGEGMSSSIYAIYEKGVFKPTEPVNLPEHCRVRVEPELSEMQTDLWDDVYTILSERYRSGETDVAARHDEHQP